MSDEPAMARIDRPPRWPHFFEDDGENPDRCFHDDELWPCSAEQMRLRAEAAEGALTEPAIARALHKGNCKLFRLPFHSCHFRGAHIKGAVAFRAALQENTDAREG